MPHRSQKRRSRAPTTNTIAFRAPADLLALIDNAAHKLSITRGELVRAIVATHFESQPAAIADECFHLAHQDRSAWSFLVEVRPFGETW